MKRQSIENGLNKNNISDYFRHLVKQGWKDRELINKSLTGGGKKSTQVDTTKLDVYIDYSIKSFNAHRKSRSKSEINYEDNVKILRRAFSGLANNITQSSSAKRRKLDKDDENEDEAKDE